MARILQAGKLLRTEGFKFDLAYTSVLKRAIKTLQNVLEELDQLWVPVEKSWRLNERHYGDLQGRNKADTAKKFGDKQVHIWRRSYDVPPAGQASVACTWLVTCKYVSALSLKICPDAPETAATLLAVPNAFQVNTRDPSTMQLCTPGMHCHMLTMRLVVRC